MQNFSSEIFSHIVRPGDTFFRLAQQYNTTPRQIQNANPGIDTSNLTIGQRINIPLGSPAATAGIAGGPLRPEIRGTVNFYTVPNGTWVCIEVDGLPPYQPSRNGEDPVGPHGFHIHESGTCQVGEPQNPFQAAGGHWNPANQPHGNHAGDFPVLFSNNGYARMCFFTSAFKPEQVTGKAIIIHNNPDDYRSQPGGNSGKRLACGIIQSSRPA